MEGQNHRFNLKVYQNSCSDTGLEQQEGESRMTEFLGELYLSFCSIVNWFYLLHAMLKNVHS